MLLAVEAAIGVRTAFRGWILYASLGERLGVRNRAQSNIAQPYSGEYSVDRPGI